MRLLKRVFWLLAFVIVTFFWMVAFQHGFSLQAIAKGAREEITHLLGSSAPADPAKTGP